MDKDRQENLEKRYQLRQSIRKRHIENKLSQSRRKIISQNQKQKQYQQVLMNSQRLFIEQKNYLSILEQTLRWEKISEHKVQFPKILTNLLNFMSLHGYKDSTSKQLQMQILCRLANQCIKMPQFSSSALKCFQQIVQNISYQVQFSKESLHNQRLVKNCLMVIDQILSNYFSEEIVSMIMKYQFLQHLQKLTLVTQNNCFILYLDIYQKIFTNQLYVNRIKDIPVELLNRCIDINPVKYKYLQIFYRSENSTTQKQYRVCINQLFHLLTGGYIAQKLNQLLLKAPQSSLLQQKGVQPLRQFQNIQSWKQFLVGIEESAAILVVRSAEQSDLHNFQCAIFDLYYWLCLFIQKYSNNEECVQKLIDVVMEFNQIVADVRISLKPQFGLCILKIYHQLLTNKLFCSAIFTIKIQPQPQLDRHTLSFLMVDHKKILSFFLEQVRLDSLHKQALFIKILLEMIQFCDDEVENILYLKGV